MSKRIDRRRFLLGAGGAALALPMLEAFAPRTSFAGGITAPKRVIFVQHMHGRPLNPENNQDNWSPAAAGPLPTTISPALAALAPIRNKIVTLDGIDNIVRHATGDSGGHGSAGTTSMTCAVPIVNGTDNESATAASIDYEVGRRIRASDSMPASIVFPAQLAGPDWRYGGYSFFGPDGAPPFIANSRPELAVEELFGSVQNPDEPPAAPTLHDRLVGRRKDILSGVAKDFSSLRKKLNAADRDRLDKHAAFIEAMKNASTGPTLPTDGCNVPDVTMFPSYAEDNPRGESDAITTPLQIENVVQMLACDIARVGVLHFHAGYDPLFPSEFPDPDPALLNSNWHALIHENWAASDPSASTLTQAFQYFGKSFTQLVQRLDQIEDLDGNKMLDNTLIVWVSDMGYGSGHYDYDIPVVLAGMPSAFPGGQGRHVVANRRTLGDLYAQVMRMVGETDTTFGATGTLGDIALTNDLVNWSGIDISASSPLHRGAIDL